MDALARHPLRQPVRQRDTVATTRVTARTGVEMESLVAASTVALTVYDMCKSMDRTMVVEQIQLEEKSGGRSGHFRRDP